MHCAIRFKSSPYFARYIANNTAKRQQFKNDDVKKALYKLIKNAPYGEIIENLARRTGICLLNGIERRRNWPKSRTVLTFAYSMLR